MNRLSAQYLCYGDRRIRIFCVGKDCPWVSMELAACGVTSSTWLAPQAATAYAVLARTQPNEKAIA
jgi:hypothetical protein